jgi:hypothetical protein
MPVYRFSWIQTATLSPAIVVEFPNDRRAIQASQALLDQKAVEVWHLARVVIRLYPKHSE